VARETRNEPDGLLVYEGKVVDDEVVVWQADAARDVQALVCLRVKHLLLTAFSSSCVHAPASLQHIRWWWCKLGCGVCFTSALQCRDRKLCLKAVVDGW
jgi:hypothetical protein